MTGYLVQVSRILLVCLVSTVRWISSDLICLLVAWGDWQLLLGVPGSLDDGVQTVTVVGLVKSTPVPSTLSLSSSSCFSYSSDSSSSASSSSLSLSSARAPPSSLPSVIDSQSLLLLLVAGLDFSSRCPLGLEHVQVLDDELVEAADEGDRADVLEGEEQR